MRAVRTSGPVARSKGAQAEVVDHRQGGRLPLAGRQLLHGGDHERVRSQLVVDYLHRHAGLVPEGCAQRLVPDQHGVPGLLQCADIKRAIQPQRPRDVIGGLPGVHLGQQPHPPLAKRGGEVVLSHDQPS